MRAHPGSARKQTETLVGDNRGNLASRESQAGISLDHGNPRDKVLSQAGRRLSCDRMAAGWGRDEVSLERRRDALSTRTPTPSSGADNENNVSSLSGQAEARHTNTDPELAILPPPPSSLSLAPHP